MERLHSRIPYAQWRLKVFRQLFLSSNASNSSFQSRRTYSTSKDDQETTSPNNQQHVDHTSRNNDRQGNSKTPSELLPQSPLITHPRPGPAIRNHKKRLPTAADRSKLEGNPWAMALASPSRYCVLSGSRIPKEFLIDWSAVVEDDPSRPAAPEPESVTDTRREKRKVRDDSNIWLLPVGLLEDKLAGLQSSGPQPLKVRMLSRMSILENMTSNILLHSKRKTLPITSLIPSRWKAALGGTWTSVNDQRLCWRPDMAEFVRWAHRAHAMKSLKRATGNRRQHDPRYGVWKSINIQTPYSEEALIEGLKRVTPFERMGDGAVLVLGDGHSTTDLPEFITIPALGSKVPVFDFTQLFSETELEEIRGYDSRLQQFAVFFRPSNRWTVEAVLALWKLQGYIREPPTWPNKESEVAN
ncbi:hypothetical protein BJY01DRAFT_168066 [Aspergillus pseudoustus]|uniref:Uncharacterized protein n=1 Tax=Aspergillus pseudoustus TaxID=1810923 RepID=A0ABR4K3N5_9EURO